MNDKRRFVRVRPAGLMSKTGKAFIDLKQTAIDCDVIDVSAGGACLTIHGAAEIPKKFILYYAGAKKTCRVVWVKGRRVGVCF